MDSKGFRSFLLIVMDGVFIIAVLDVARLIVRFFGELSSTPFGEQFVSLSRYLVFPLGVDPTRTNFGGLFDWNTAITIGILLILEAILGLLRRRA